MGVMLKIQDETTLGKRIYESLVEFHIESITVRKLIETRVEIEVENYNKNAEGEFAGFVQPTESEQILNGYKIKRGVLIDVEKQKKAAINAFNANGFFIIVNDQQLTELNDEIVITPGAVVVFLKLVPLVGG